MTEPSAPIIPDFKALMASKKAPPRQPEYSHEENSLLVYLYLSNKDEYHAPSTTRSTPGMSTQERFARQWAAELTKLGVARRNSTSVKQRILGLRKYATRMIKRQVEALRTPGVVHRKTVPVEDYGQALIDSIRSEMINKNATEAVESARLENSKPLAIPTPFPNPIAQPAAPAEPTPTFIAVPKAEPPEPEQEPKEPELSDNELRLQLGTETPMTEQSDGPGMDFSLQPIDVMKAEVVQLELAIAAENLKCAQLKRRVLQEELEVAKEKRALLAAKRQKLNEDA